MDGKLYEEMKKMYQVAYGREEDITSWMELVKRERENFPGLETEEGLEDYKQTTMKFMKDQRALCVKEESKVIGVLLFSKKHNMICCLAVAVDYRKKGIASLLIQQAIEQLDRKKDIVVTTFREEDPKGIAPRALYKKFGFVPDELVEEFGYPNQKFVLKAGEEPYHK